MAYDEKIYQVALNLIPGIGHRLIKQLISYCGSASAVFSRNFKQLSKIPGIGIIHAQSILGANYFQKAEGMINDAAKYGACLLFYLDKKYPANLKQLIDAPTLLYHYGRSDLNNRKIIAIVGSRRATSYGKDVVQQIITGLEKHNPLIVSGLAYGIDISAHRMALKSKLATVGVLAGGVDCIYPKLHSVTAYEMIKNNGGLISEYPLGTQADPRFFPARNRIIAGLSDAVIVVEAALKGGALITANIADSYNKDIFAVPGNINNIYSEGCNRLILHHKANIFTSIADFEKQMGWDQIDHNGVNKKEWEIDETLMSENELKIITILRCHPDGIHIDRLSIESQISIHQVASLLLPLEFKGILKAMPGKKFKLL